MITQTKLVIYISLAIVSGLALAGVLFFVKPKTSAPTNTNVTNTPSNSNTQTNTNTPLAVLSDFIRRPNRAPMGNQAILNNEIWTANGHGLVRYSVAEDRTQVYTEADGLLHNSTWDVATVGNDIWVASQSAGISIFHPAKETWEYMTTKTGLVNDSNPDLLYDGTHVWLASFDGVGRYNVKTKKWQNWLEGDGILMKGVLDMVMNDQAVWIFVTPNAYTQGGVLRFDRAKETWEDVSKNNTVFVSRQLEGPKLSLVGNYLYAVVSKNQVGSFILSQDLTTGQWSSETDSPERRRALHLDQPVLRDQYWDFGEDGSLTITPVGAGQPQTLDTAVLKDRCADSTAPGFAPHGVYQKGYQSTVIGINQAALIPCGLGFAQYDLTTKAWSFLDVSEGQPTDIRSLNDHRGQELLVDGNRGFGILNMATAKWTSVGGTDGLAVQAGRWNGDRIYVLDITGTNEYAGPAVNSLVLLHTAGTPAAKIDLGSSELSLQMIDFDNTGKLWIAHGNALKLIDDQKVLKTIPLPEEINVVIGGQLDGAALTITSHQTVGQYQTDTGAWTFIPGPTDSKGQPHRIQSIAWANDALWVNPADGSPQGLFRYNADQKDWTLFEGGKELTFGQVDQIATHGDQVALASQGRTEKEEHRRGDNSVVTTASTYIYERDGLDILRAGQPKFLTSEDGLLGGEIFDLLAGDEYLWYRSSNGLGGVRWSALK